MKRIATIFAAILALILGSCEKETVLTIDQTSLSFTDNGGSQSVSLTANKPWSVKSDQSWCIVSPSAGEEAVSSRITFTCEENTTYNHRVCMVTFTCAELTRTVFISQTAKNGLMVSQTSYDLTNEAQQLNIEVQANVKFSVDVENDCKDWVTYNMTKVLTTLTVVLDISENKTYDSREGKVTIKQDGGPLSSTISIKQNQLNELSVTTPEYSLSHERHTLSVEIKSNIDFEVKSEADWIKYVETKGLKTNQIILDVSENDGNVRVGEVLVYSKSAPNDVHIRIEQAATPEIVRFDDPLFENYCLYWFDTNKDGIVTYTEALDVEWIEVTNEYSGSEYESHAIKSLSGIEYFPNLCALYCENNQLTSLDLSKNTKLELFYCQNNQLSSITMDGCTALVEFNCRNNRLSSLNLKNFNRLIEVVCDGNQLNNLELQGCTALNTVHCFDNQIISLDVSDCVDLLELFCTNNRLVSLDVSNNSLLVTLKCASNPLLKEIWLKTGQTIEDFTYDTDVAIIKYKD